VQFLAHRVDTHSGYMTLVLFGVTCSWRTRVASLTNVAMTADRLQMSRRTMPIIQSLVALDITDPTTPYMRCHTTLLDLQCFDAVGWAAGRASGL